MRTTDGTTPATATWTPVADSPLGDSPLPTPTVPATFTATAPVTATATVTSPAEAAIPIYGYEVINTYPHDPTAFTQGLVWADGVLYEGTGLYGQSSLRKVDLESGQVLQSLALPADLFGEGVTLFNDQIYQLTWQAHIGFVYAKETFTMRRQFSYPTEGWGITHDGETLIMSDGSSTLYFWDPETLDEIGRIQVTAQSEPVVRLNELEYIDGLIYANIWQTDRIARIDPQTGAVEAWIDLTGLLPAEARTGSEDVLNGIAHDAENDRLFVTGKLWPLLFEIKLTLP